MFFSFTIDRHNLCGSTAHIDLKPFRCTLITPSTEFFLSEEPYQKHIHIYYMLLFLYLISIYIFIQMYDSTHKDGKETTSVQEDFVNKIITIEHVVRR